jgi:DNA (cytosine-5)-methyltransferase 1
MAMMATKKTAKFLIENDDWNHFTQCCEAQGTYPSAVLREYCETYSKGSTVSVEKNKQKKSPKSALSALNGRKICSQSVGELYSGPGGIGLGAAMAEVDTESERWITEPRWTNDYCADTCKTWENNVLKYEREQKSFKGDVDVIAGDVRELDIEGLAQVDGLMFGFPCNDFSLVGEKKGFDGDFGPLYSYGVKVLQKKENPSWFIAENVGGITSSNEGNAFTKILSDLRTAGYSITAHKYKLEQYGIPQARHRVIIVGFRNDLDLKFQVPATLDFTITAGEALSKPIPPNTMNTELTKQSARVVERLSYIDPGENCWNAKRLPDHLKLNVANTKLSHIYKKIDPNKPSYTVTGSGGGGTHMYHWAENRALTNRERARLQTFPDWFEFCGSKESVRKQIGMAIPVEASKLIVEAVLKTLAGESYSSIEPNIKM